MGRYSDSEDEKRRRKKKKKKRSRSRSLSSDDSKLSSKAKKSKKSKHKRKSRSRSRDGYRRSRSRSRGRRSRSYDRKSRSRSRGRRSRSPIYRKSRSLSRERYSRRRSRSGSYDRRRRSRSYSRDRYSRSRSRDRYSRSRSREMRKGKSRRRSRSDDRSRGNSSKYDSRSPSRVKVKEEKPVDPCTNVPGFSEMTPSEKAQVRMQMALKAAAAADEKIKEQLNRGPVSGSFEDQMKFSSAVNDIESSTFVQTSFKSNRNDKPVEVKKEKDDFNFGTAAEFKPDMNPRKALNLDEFTDFAHPNLHVDPDVKMERWIQRLTSLRRRKLEGEVIT